MYAYHDNYDLEGVAKDVFRKGVMNFDGNQTRTVVDVNGTSRKVLISLDGKIRGGVRIDDRSFEVCVDVDSLGLQQIEWIREEA